MSDFPIVFSLPPLFNFTYLACRHMLCNFFLFYIFTFNSKMRRFVGLRIKFLFFKENFGNFHVKLPGTFFFLCHMV